MKIASWNVNSIRARLDHVTAWLKAQNPDVLLLQELKGTEFPAAAFQELGYESVAVTQKAYNGVAILSRHRIETIGTVLAGDEADEHARFLETAILGIRMVNIYLPNGNPVGSDKFAYKLAWMDRLHQEMCAWLREDLPVLIESRVGEGVYLGRSYREAPEVDPKIIVRGDGLNPGDFTNVQITTAYAFDLAGKLRI